jgi:hypothetical protein
MLRSRTIAKCLVRETSQAQEQPRGAIPKLQDSSRHKATTRAERHSGKVAGKAQSNYLNNGHS